MYRQSLLDHTFSIYANRKGMFNAGWGNHAILQYIIDLGSDNLLKKLNNRRLSEIKIEWSKKTTFDDFIVTEGSFESPFCFYWQQGRKKLVEKLPEECRQARFELIEAHGSNKHTPLIIHFAATGDEGFALRKKLMAIPLSKHGVNSLILENPYYGSRRPLNYSNSQMNTVTDFLQMSRAVQDEGIALLKFFKKSGHTKLGVTGISMGAYMALSVASQTSFPIAISACLPTHSASAPYTKGTFKKSCNWGVLANGLKNDKNPEEIITHIFELADIRKMPVPHNRKQTILVAANKDAYIPEFSTILVHDHWKGSNLRWIRSGHIGSILFHNKRFVRAVLDSLQCFADK